MLQYHSEGAMKRSVTNGALWLSLVTCVVYSLSTRPQNDNWRGKTLPSSPFTAPRASTADRRGPKYVDFAPSGPPPNTKTRRKPQAPLVDSTLLRFLSTQKQIQPCDTDTLPPDTLPKEDIIQTQQAQPSSLGTWLGQYNRNRVAQTLFRMENAGISQETALQAGEAVQQHVMARRARRSLRLFLRKRDQLWDNLSPEEEEEDVTRFVGFPETETTTTATTNEETTTNTTTTTTLSNNNHGLFTNVVELLVERGLTANDICSILTHTPSVALMRPRNGENTLESTCHRVLQHVLCDSLQLRRYDARKVIRNCPGLLTVKGSKNAQQVVTLLSTLGVSTKSLARDKNALPILLSRSPAQLFRLVAFLASDAVRMPLTQIGPLLRRAECASLLNAIAPIPQLQQDLDSACMFANEINSNTAGSSSNSSSSNQEHKIRREQINDIYRQMSATAWTLRHEIGTQDLGKVIAAYPSVLLLDAKTQILPCASYLMNELGIWEDDLPRVLQLYPALLGMNVEEMKRVPSYLVSLEVAEENLASIFRAFPSLLTLDVEKDMEPVIEFIRKIGIVNIGRFVTRLPPILGYSVEEELVPKWEYLRRVCTQASFELSTFPAYFSYPLDRVIKTRYEYLLNEKRFPTQFLALDVVLRYGDRDFATQVARDTDGGVAFLQFAQRRKNNSPGVVRQRTRIPATKKNTRSS